MTGLDYGRECPLWQRRDFWENVAANLVAAAIAFGVGYYLGGRRR